MFETLLSVISSHVLLFRGKPPQYGSQARLRAIAVSGAAQRLAVCSSRLRAQPRARQGPQGIGWKLGAKASGFYFCVLGRPRAMGLIRAWGSGVSSIEATHKPLQRPGAQDVGKNWEGGRETDQSKTEAQTLRQERALGWVLEHF